MLKKIPHLSMILFLCLAMSATVTLAQEDVRQAQLELQQLGFNPGPIDGIMGPLTRGALRDFQQDRGLAVTGRLDTRTREALGISRTVSRETRTVRSDATTIPAGTRIPVRLNDRLDSGENRVGDTFGMTVSEDVVIDGSRMLSAGAQIVGRVDEVEAAKRPQKGGKMVLTAETLIWNGQRIPINGHVTAEGEELEGEGSLKEDLKEVAIGAGIGALIGGLTKGKGGALAGILIGGGGTFLATKGEQVELDEEAPLLVQIRNDVRLR